MTGTALQRFRHAGSLGAPSRPQVLLPVIALVAVAMAWGGAFVVVKSAVAQLSPAGLVAWRFTIATAFLLLCKPSCLRGLRARTVLSAVALGCLFGAGFLLQTWGIQSTTVVLSAFIAGSAVVLAPLVARIWFGRRVNRATAGAIALATAGLALISLRGNTFGMGELLTLGAAGLWAVHLVALERWSRRSDVMAMALIQLAVVAALGWVAAALVPGGTVLPSSPSTWTALLALGVFGTGIPLVLLTWAQTRVNATTSAVVLTLEPVFGAVAAITVGGEEWAGLILLGALVVVAGAVIVARYENGASGNRRSAVSASTPHPLSLHSNRSRRRTSARCDRAGVRWRLEVRRALKCVAQAERRRLPSPDGFSSRRILLRRERPAPAGAFLGRRPRTGRGGGSRQRYRAPTE